MKRRSVGTFLLHVGLTLAGLSAIFPFLWMLLLSLQETSLTLTAPALRWPWPLSLANYVNAWHAIPLALYLSCADALGASQALNRAGRFSRNDATPSRASAW